MIPDSGLVVVEEELLSRLFNEVEGVWTVVVDDDGDEEEEEEGAAVMVVVVTDSVTTDELGPGVDEMERGRGGSEFDDDGEGGEG